MTDLLVASGLTITYTTRVETVRALDRVSLTVGTGELVCIHGASGSGKTTLMEVMAGLRTPDVGQVLLEGVDVVAASDAQRARMRLTSIGVVFQHSQLLEEFSARENIAVPLEARGVKMREAAALADEALERVGLAGLGHRRPHELSGGQQQRVGIARAIAGERRILVADEPTGALDSQNSRDIFELLYNLSLHGHGVLVASHDPSCQKFSSRSCTMSDGRLYAD